MNQEKLSKSQLAAWKIASNRVSLGRRDGLGSNATGEFIVGKSLRFC
jgi:hypothetical protein